MAANANAPRFVLVAHELSENGETGAPITDPQVAKQVGQAAGLGNPTDEGGWGIWEVPATKQN